MSERTPMKIYTATVRDGGDPFAVALRAENEWEAQARLHHAGYSVVGFPKLSSKTKTGRGTETPIARREPSTLRGDDDAK